MHGADSRNHLLWPVLAENLARGRGGEAALLAGERVVSYGRLASAALRGAREIDGRFAPGARLLVAARNQLHVGLALTAALQSRCVPLLADPTSLDRLRQLAGEWRIAGAIGDAEVLEACGAAVLDAQAIEAWVADGATEAERYVPPAVASDEPAFWTFTSGTTGEPKAVVHGHRGPRAAYEAFGTGVVALGPEDVTIATAGLPFVYALGNALFFPLMAGATAVLPSDLLLPTVLGELARHGATVLVAGPWSLSGIVRLARRTRWVDAIRRLRCVLSAGEALPPVVFREWRKRFGKEVLDNLGCTEMFNSFASNFSGRARAGILGEVVPGFELRVGGSAPAPGARGALAVRGASRAVAVGSGGALRRPEGDWCETGDEVAVDQGGALLFLGRGDDRFKIKGRFLHPLEVERVLAEVAGIAECLVTAERDENGLTIVVAKVVPSSAADAKLAARLLRHARAELEPHAIPARVDVVEALPRSARGKLLRPPPVA